MRDEVVSVVAGGPSVRQIDLSRIPGTIIAINDSAIHLPRVDIVVSMDRLWTENRFDRLRALMKPAHIRRAALKNIVGRWPWLTAFDCDHTSIEMSDQVGVLNGTNSGMCGINLAYQMRPAQLFLFGFDMKRTDGNAYWYPPYDWNPPGGTKDGKYVSWSKQFDGIARQCNIAGIDIAMVGDSAVKLFRCVSAVEFNKAAA